MLPRRHGIVPCWVQMIPSQAIPPPPTLTAGTTRWTSRAEHVRDRRIEARARAQCGSTALEHTLGEAPTRSDAAGGTLAHRGVPRPGAASAEWWESNRLVVCRRHRSGEAPCSRGALQARLGRIPAVD